MCFFRLRFFSDEEYGEKSISVKLDGEEVELSFIDHPSNEMSVGGVWFWYSRQ